MIVPVLFLKSLQMLSADRRLIVRRGAERSGEERREREESRAERGTAASYSTSADTKPQRTLCHIELVSHTHTQTHAAAHAHSHFQGIDWHKDEEGLLWGAGGPGCMVRQGIWAGGLYYILSDFGIRGRGPGVIQ